ncbi:MAG: MarR family transcriptional regulator [Hyphomicrobiales bacterium]
MDDIITSLERVSRLMRSAEYVAGLNPAQWEALRYLNRCNRLSNSPMALAKFLGATKGTISQTLTALSRKGLIERTMRKGNARSIELAITDLGRERLASDPWNGLQETIDQLPRKVRKRMAEGLAALRDAEIQRRRGQHFGVCRQCRFCSEATSGDGDVAYRCLYVDVPIAPVEVDQLCMEYVPR